MPIIIIFLVAGVLYLLQDKIYERYWIKNLHAKVDFSQQSVHEGEEVFLLETVSNGKILPMPWVYVKFQLNRNGHTEQYRSDLFSIRFFQKIRRKVPMDTSRRGLYTVQGVDLISNNLFITNKYVSTLSDTASLTVYPRLINPEEFRIPYQQMMGEIVTRRYMLEDPFLFKGIREYQPYDSFKSINFKASAKAGEWLVNVNEYTVSQKITILLNMERANQYYDPRLYENSIRMAASIANAFEQDGIPVSLITNGKDVVTEEEILVDPGSGSGHLDSLFGALARLEIDLEVRDFSIMIREAAEENRQDTMYVLISPFFGERVVESFTELRERHKESIWILPVNASDLISPDSLVHKVELSTDGVFLWTEDQQ